MGSGDTVRVDRDGTITADRGRYLYIGHVMDTSKITAGSTSKLISTGQM